MLFSAQRISYRDTQAFSKIVLDYIDGAEALRPFYAALPNEAGIRQIIEAKQLQALDRVALVQVLRQQYENAEQSNAVTENIDALLTQNTFTVCTAHQPKLFTGPLYFIYKILHAIRLSNDLKQTFPKYHFVPVYYMGSEDADKEELLHTSINGKRYEWNTTQTGAVGRMTIDKALLQLLDDMSGQLNVFPFGAEITKMLAACYAHGKNLQTATFQFVHGLFKKYGLVVIIPDHEGLKKLMLPIFEADLFQQMPSEIVAQTCQQLDEQYKVQANPREINLFYLNDGIRNRIVKVKEGYLVHETTIRFTQTELHTELQEHPERFSPNVILRGIFQETILPNIAFIGGGGELSYWLQLKDLFQHYAVPFPGLVLRNSFLILEKKWRERIEKLNVDEATLFMPELNIINAVLAQQNKLPQLNGELQQVVSIYDHLKKLAGNVDVTLNQYVEALKVKTIHQLQNV
jgi:bacillithiol biosynthesis cysteine-adding enzyme BshC